MWSGKGDVARIPNWGGKKSQLNHHQSQKLTDQVSYLAIAGRSVICSINSSHLSDQDRHAGVYVWKRVWMHGFAIMHYIRKTVQMWTSHFQCSLWCPVAELGSGGVFYTQDTAKREDRTGWKRGGGRKSDINLLCPLTLQRLAVNQSRPHLFQKALFDRAG